MAKTLVFGAGYLGKRISEALGYQLTDFRVSNNVSELESFLDSEKPSTVVCALGKTGRPNIDWCEFHKQETLEGNVIAPIRLAAQCAKRDIYFVNIGSGCIYAGYKSGEGFNEKDEPNFYGPQFYAKTKILFEKLLFSMPSDSPKLQLRIRMPIDDRSHERNFIDKVSKYKRVITVPNSMTTVPHMLPAMRELINRKATGIYNLVNPGVISAAQIMELYKQIVNPNHEFETFSVKELDEITAGKRSNCLLNTDKLQTAGIILPEIHKAVKDCLLKYSGN